MSESQIEKIFKKFELSEDLQLKFRDVLEKYKSLDQKSKSEFISQAKNHLSKFIPQKLISLQSKEMIFLQTYAHLLIAIFFILLIFGMNTY